MGLLRVMNDGLIGRNKKLLKLVETLNLEGWDWLRKVKEQYKTGDDDTVSHRMSEVITGRPVLSMSKDIGGFRLRYGRCYNTGFSTIGIHPTVPILLDNAIVVGYSNKNGCSRKGINYCFNRFNRTSYCKTKRWDCIYRYNNKEQAIKFKKSN